MKWTLRTASAMFVEYNAAVILAQHCSGGQCLIQNISGGCAADEEL